MPENKIEFLSVYKSYAGMNGAGPVAVLQNISFAVPAGEIMILLGPSGSGKSTCLRLMAHLDSPDSGRVTLDGEDIAAMDVLSLRCRVAMVFQVPIFFDGNVADNIGYGLRLRGASTDDCLRAAREKIGLVGLDEDMLAREANTLSPGEQQRVSIARALAGNPEVLLLDEPTASLDPTAGNQILQLVSDLKNKLGLTIVLITHRLEQARQIGDDVLFLYGGRICEQGPAGQLLDRAESKELQLFLSGNL